MNETIEQVKKDLEFFESKGYYPKRLASSLTGTLYSLITTIESQKEEIENQREIIAHQGKGLLQERQQVESLKAITELAVKGVAKGL